jgi:hypothetical protein
MKRISDMQAAMARDNYVTRLGEEVGLVEHLDVLPPPLRKPCRDCAATTSATTASTPRTRSSSPRSSDHKESTFHPNYDFDGLRLLRVGGVR